MANTYERDRTAYIKLTGNPYYGTVLDGAFAQSLYSDTGFLTIGLNLAVLKACLVDRPDSTVEQWATCRDDLAQKLVQELIDRLPASESASPAAAAALALRTDRPSPATPTALVGETNQAQLSQPGDLRPAVLAARSAAAPTVEVSGVFYAVRCGDGGNWHSAQWWINRTARLGPRYPLQGYNGFGMEVCPYWKLPAQELPQPNANKLGPLVTVQSEFDPATAYESTARNVKRFVKARLIAIDDAGGHGQYVVAGNGCVNALVDGYLAYDAVPARRTVCTALPLLFEDRSIPAAGRWTRSVAELGRPHPNRPLRTRRSSCVA